MTRRSGLLPRLPWVPPTPPFRLLVCGDRNWEDRGLVRRVLKAIGPSSVSVLIDGGCRGADTIAHEEGRALGFSYVRYRAKWAAEGRAAGPIRNRRMLDEARPAFVVAFHDDLPKSRGTKDMFDAAAAAGLPVLLVGHTKATFLYARTATFGITGYHGAQLEGFIHTLLRGQDENG